MAKSINPFAVDYDLPRFVRKTLIDRARLRLPDVRRVRAGVYEMAGRAALSDEFDLYTVHDGLRWQCSCQSHAGGGHRGTCSHIAAAMICQRYSWDPVQEFEARPDPAAVNPFAVDHEEEENPFAVDRDEADLWLLANRDQWLKPGGTGFGDPNRTHCNPPELFPVPDSFANPGLVQWPNQLDQIEARQSACEHELFEMGFCIGCGLESGDAAAGWSGLAKTAPDLADHEEISRPKQQKGKIQGLPDGSFESLLLECRLPDWAPQLRAHQLQALRKIFQAFRSGKKNVILEAPTGAGKTLIGYMVAQLAKARMVYICTTKSLQDQFLADFSQAKMIKGKRNYPTVSKPFPQWTGEDCDFKKSEGCSHCPSPDPEKPASCKWTCPYSVAKRKAEAADLAVLNTAYFLATVNMPSARQDNKPGWYGHDQDHPESVGFDGRGVGVFDEADELESTLRGYIELEIGPRVLDELELEAPDPNKSRWPDRLAWLGKQVCPAVEECMFAAAEAEDQKAYTKWQRIWNQAQAVLGDLAELQTSEEFRETWVYDRKENGAALFKPVMVAKFGRPLLFNHCGLNLIMSATIVSPEHFAADLGLDWSDTEFVSVGSTFPKERRPIFLHPVANVTFKESATARPKLAAKIAQIISKHPDDRTLVHCVSYDLAAWLMDAVARLAPEHAGRLMTYRSGDERDEAIARYLRGRASVIFAPSLERGINWKGDDCRCVIVAKNPWPNKSDKQVSRRCYQPTPREGELWYRRQALATVVQMTGRGMRSETDWCRTYILDEQFMGLFRKSKHMLGSWWTEACRSDSADPLDRLGIK